MDYILKNQYLNLDSKNKNPNYQYYHWAQKKRVEKQKHQYELFKKTWHNIQQEQQKDKSRVIVKKVKKSPLKTGSIQPQQLYNKNVLWKQRVESKLQKKRQQLRQEKQRQIQLMKQSKIKELKLIRDQQHKGPVKAWKQRFDNYLKIRSGQDNNEQNLFTPQIDRNSRRITKQMYGKVEDRLIQYGQKLKQKKIEMQIIYQQQLQAQRNIIISNNESIQSQISDVYWRLYKDGQRLNQKRNQYKSNYTFTPQINKYSQQIASRISQKRPPLYQSKLNNKILTQCKNQNKDKDKKSNQKSFNDFLKRNQALLHKIQKNKIKKIEILKQKQQNQFKQCTFTPVLNPKSMKLFNNYNTNQQTDFIQKIQNLSNIEQNILMDQQSTQKRLVIVQSQKNQFHNNNDKIGKSTQRIQRLQSYGNLPILNESNHLFIDSNQSISNYNQSKKNSESIKYYQHPTSRYRSHDSDILPSQKTFQKQPIQNIHEENQEDSIEKEKDSHWQRQLQQMEKQIEAMMMRTGN